MFEKDSSSVLDLFRQSLQASPNKIAVEDGMSEHLSYQQLDIMSSKLAHYLRQYDVQIGQPIPILTTSCCQMVVGILGILKTGACYVPIDRSQWPKEKIGSVIERVGADLVLYTGSPPDIPTHRAICIGVENALKGPAPVLKTLCRQNGSSERMCIIFTSGTTDKPKGVILTHMSVLNLVSSPQFNFGMSRGERMLLVLSVGFDAFMGALFSTICNGGTAVLANSDTIQERAATTSVFAVTPSILDVLTSPSSKNEYPMLKRVILGGETPSQRLITDWSFSNADFWIAYGPTEATCTIMTGLLQADKTGRYQTTQLGKPIPNSTIVLIDKDMHIINDIGLEGEILVSGRCLAEGYWGDEELTKAKFIQYHGERTYRTGDMGKWVATESGSRTIEFAGRRDRITKIRGFLVNLSHDLDAKVLQLDRCLTFSFSLVLEGMLIAVVGPKGVDTERLLSRWRTIAPAYMVPDHLLALDCLPLMNGKTDVKALKGILRERLPAVIQCEEYGNSSPNEVIMAALSQTTNIPISKFDLDKTAVSYGVHSLAAIKISTLCRQQGFKVSVRSILLAPTIRAVVDQCVSQILPTTSQMPKSYLKEATTTLLQKGLLLATLDSPGVNYVQHVSSYATGDITRVKEAWSLLVSAEPMFRLAFTWLGTEPIQSLHPRAAFDWKEKVVSTQQEIDMTLQDLAQDAQFGNSFTALHCTGNELEPCQSILVWTVHHALIDGYSASLIFEKLDNILQGKNFKISLPFTLAVQDMECLRRETITDAQDFWSERKPLFAEASGDIILSSSDTTPREHGHAQIIVDDTVSRERVLSFAQAANITPAVIYNAAWALLLASYTGSDTIVYGSIFSGRSLPFDWAETMVGPLLSTSPIIVQIDRSQSSVDFLQQMHRHIQLLAGLNGSHPPSDVPSVSTTVTVQDEGLRRGTSVVKQLREPYFRNTSITPLNLVVNPDGAINIFYRTESFLQSQVQAIGAVYSNLLGVILHDRMTLQRCLDLKLSLTMRKGLLENGNFQSSSSRTRDTALTITDLFGSAAIVHSSWPAIQQADITLTYSELSDRVEKVAAIISVLVPPGVVVAVLADRSINWIIGMMAAMRADTIYCPVDASYPAEYRAQLLERSKAKLLLFPDSTQIASPGLNGPLVLAIGQIVNSNINPADCLTRAPRPSSTAYICFTSGSTGQPKGVLCRHRGIVALYSSPAARPSSHPGVRVAQMLSPGFDGCIHEILSTLCFGGTLVLRRKKDDVFSHLQNVDVAVLTPSVAAELNPQDYLNLKSIHFGGEHVSTALVEKWGAGRKIYNIYGPTEASILVCHCELKPGYPVTIGRPLPSARIYILNERMELQPPFVAGMIFIAGVQVAQGYHNMEQKTSEEILPDPFYGSSTGESMYRSGDIGFWDEQGNLHCCGRNDRQVKLRGFRINLDDITTLVTRVIPSVGKSIATLDNGSVVLWVEPEETDTELLKRQLAQALPPHAAPKKLIALKRLPRTHNGKIDTKALASHVPTSRPTATAASETLTLIEKGIAEEWRQLLKLDETIRISSSNDFALLGGHSLLQLALAARMREIFRIPITVSDIIQAPTLGSLAQLVQTWDVVQPSPNLRESSGDLIKSLGLNDPSPAELEWIYRYQTSEVTSAFNVPYVVELSSEVNIQRLASALKTVLNRHQILRSRFTTQGGKVQRSISSDVINVPLIVDVDIAAFINQPFQLDKEHPIRAVASNSTLIICASHVVLDLTALNVILHETADVYHEKRLGPLEVEYFDCTVWKNSVKPIHASFWPQYLDGFAFSDSTVGDTSLEEPPRRLYSGTSLMQDIPRPLYEKMLALSSCTGVTMHQFGLAVVGFVLHTLCGRNDVLLGAPYMNRPSTSDMSIVGLFLQPLPVRIRENVPGITTNQALLNVRKSCQSALAHAIPWHQLLSLLNLPFPTLEPVKQRQQQPLFDCVVTFHDNRGLDTDDSACPIKYATPIPFSAEGAKFSCLFEWQADNHDLKIRYEYDTDSLPAAFINILKRMVTRCLERMLDSNYLMQSLRSDILQALWIECQKEGFEVTEAHRLAKTFLQGIKSQDQDCSYA